MHFTRDCKARRRARPAFTYIELAMSLAIMTILSAIAAPRYANFTTRHRMQSATRRVMSDLSLAARRARLKGASQTVAFDVINDSYAVGDLLDPDDPSKPYVTRIAAEPYNAAIVSADFGGDADLVFDAFGVPDTNGSIVIRVGRFQQTIPITGADGSRGVVVVDPKSLPDPEMITN